MVSCYHAVGFLFTMSCQTHRTLRALDQDLQGERPGRFSFWSEWLWCYGLDHRGFKKIWLDNLWIIYGESWWYLRNIYDIIIMISLVVEPYPSEKYESVGMIINNILWENMGISNMFQTTNQILYCNHCMHKYIWCWLPGIIIGNIRWSCSCSSSLHQNSHQAVKKILDLLGEHPSDVRRKKDGPRWL